MRLCLERLLLSALFTVPSVVANAQENRDSSLTMRSEVDTLREIVVRPDSSLRMNDAIDKSLKRKRQPRNMSLGDVLDKLSPGLQDKITHPFAVKDRKRDRKHKRDRQILKEYDSSKTPNDLLKEALRREGLGAIIDQRENSK